MILGRRVGHQEDPAGIRLPPHHPSLEIVILTMTSQYIVPIFQLGNIPEPSLGGL